MKEPDSGKANVRLRHHLFRDLFEPGFLPDRLLGAFSGAVGVALWPLRVFQLQVRFAHGGTLGLD